jgi:drug/metabolite transporter (DMT)-like permease
MSAAGRPVVAGMAALLASLLWASYYLFVLYLDPTMGPAGLLAYPFVFGGIAYTLVAVGQGYGRVMVQLFREPSGYLRMLLLFGMQVGVLASTYTAGPVDTSLLSLVGDVTITPILVMVLLRQATDRARSPAFWTGVVLSTAGASLTILGGRSAPALHGLAWLVAPVVPLAVAFYFLLTAQANIRLPGTAVVAQATLGAAALSLLASPLLPGGAGGLGIASPTDLVLVAGLGVTSFFVGPYLYFRAIEWAGLLLPALLMATIPVFTLFLALAAFHTAPVLLGLIGIPVAVVGAALALRGSHPGWTPTHTSPGSPAK